MSSCEHVYNETLNRCILVFQREVVKKYNADVNKYQSCHKYFLSDGHSCNIFGQFLFHSSKLKIKPCFLNQVLS